MILGELIFAPGIPINKPVAPPGVRRPSELKAVRPGSVLCSFSIDPHNAAFPPAPDNEDPLTADIFEFASQYGLYGCRTMAQILRFPAGRIVNDKALETTAAFER